MIDISQQMLTEDLKKQIYEGFSRHAIIMTGHDEKFQPIAFLAQERGCFVGAIVLESFWGNLHVKYLYVDENYRGKGIGASLIERTLKMGRESSCSFVFVETMSFQALEFYQKMGFQLEFTRSGYAHGTSFHYLKRDL